MGDTNWTSLLAWSAAAVLLIVAIGAMTRGK